MPQPASMYSGIFYKKTSFYKIGRGYIDVSFGYLYNFFLVSILERGTHRYVELTPFVCLSRLFPKGNFVLLVNSFSADGFPII